MLYFSTIGMAQNLPAETYRVDSLRFNSNTRYKISTRVDECFDVSTVLGTRYFQFGRSSNIIRISPNSDLSSPTVYSVSGDYFTRERARFNLSNIPHSWGTNRISTLSETEARPLTRRYAENFCVDLSHGISYVGEESTSSHTRYSFMLTQNRLRRYTVDFDVYDDITGEILSSRTVNRNADGVAELSTTPSHFDIERPERGHRHRIVATVRGGEQGEFTETFTSLVNADQNIIIKDFGQQYVRFWTTSNITNNDDRINVEAVGRVGGRIIHSSYDNWKRINPNRVLAGGYTKEYIYRYADHGTRRVENFETIIVKAQRDTQGEFPEQFELQGPQPQVDFRLSRNGESNEKNARWTIQYDWNLHGLPPGWTMDQISGITTSAYSDEHAGWVREQVNGLSFNGTRYPGSGHGFRSSDMWRFTDNAWEWTLTFFRTTPDGRRERYTIRYHSTDNNVRPAPNRTTHRHYRYQGGNPNEFAYWLARSHRSHWSEMSFPNDIHDDQDR